MKKNISFLIIIITSYCNSQIVNFASPWLKANMVSSNTTTHLRAKDLSGNWLKIDENNDGEIQLSEALNVSFYNDTEAHVADYGGINSFTNLEYLSFANNPIPAPLNLSGLNHLKSLYCYNNNLTLINFGGCLALETVSLNTNYLTWLDLAGLPNLKNLECQNNDLINLTLTSTPSLQTLYCFNNNLTSLNLDNHPNLELLYCNGNFITDLTLNNCPNLNTLICYSNYLQTLNVDGLTNLTTLSCGSNHLHTLDVSNCNLITYLDCSYNMLVSLNINNGFNWTASNQNPQNTSFIGSYNGSISQVCTSTASVPTIINYYLGTPVNVSNCVSLGLNENHVNKILFYPNPTREKIFFSNEVDQVSVYDIKGALIKTYLVNNKEMNVSELATGLYILKIISEGKSVLYNKLLIR